MKMFNLFLAFQISATARILVPLSVIYTHYPDVMSAPSSTRIFFSFLLSFYFEDEVKNKKKTSSSTTTTLTAAKNAVHTIASVERWMWQSNGMSNVYMPAISLFVELFFRYLFSLIFQTPYSTSIKVATNFSFLLTLSSILASLHFFFYLNVFCFYLHYTTPSCLTIDHYYVLCDCCFFSFFFLLCSFIPFRVYFFDEPFLFSFID